MHPPWSGKTLLDSGYFHSYILQQNTFDDSSDFRENFTTSKKYINL